MTQSIRKAIGFILVLMLCGSALAGCGKTEDKSSNTEVTTDTVSENQSVEKQDSEQDLEKQDGEEPAESGQEITLTFPCIWVGSDSKAEVFAKMVNDFNEEYKGKYQVKIEEQTDYDAYEDKIRTLISTGSAPDLFTVKSFADVQLFAEAGNLMDLTELLEGELADRFTAGMIKNNQIDGISYAMPYENAVVPIMYNQTLLDSAGVSELPANFEELWEVCEKLKEAGVSPLGQMTGNNAWTSMLWYSYAVAACGGENVYQNGLDDPAFVQAAEILKKMFDYTTSDAVGADATVVNGHFFNERTAIYTNGTWIIGRIKTEGAEGLYDNLTLSAGLSNGEENGGAYLNAVQAYICAGRQEDPAKQEAVEAFMKFITEKDKVIELANSSGALFAIDVDASLITDELQAEIVRQSTNASFMIDYFSAAVPTAVANAFPAALEELVLGEISAEEFVEALKAAE